MDYYQRLGYERSNKIPNNCERCKEIGVCIEHIISKNSNKELLSKYLTKTIDLECMSSNTCNCSDNANKVAERIAQELISTDLSVLIDLLKESKDREAVTTDNIPQYGDLSIAMYLIPELLQHHEHLGYIEFGKLMFYHEGKKDEAYRKYAENHCKLAALLDLAIIKKKVPSGYEIVSSTMGRYFTSLPIEEKDKLLPKLCLRIPIVQEALISNNHQESIYNNLSILSESTRIRRRKGVNDLVDFALDE